MIWLFVRTYNSITESHSIENTAMADPVARPSRRADLSSGIFGTPDFFAQALAQLRAQCRFCAVTRVFR